VPTLAPAGKSPVRFLVRCNARLPTVSYDALQAVLSQQCGEAPAAMLVVKLIAERTSAQRYRVACSGEALDVRWAKAHATLAPASSPSVVAEHLAGKLLVRSTESPLLSLPRR